MTNKKTIEEQLKSLAERLQASEAKLEALEAKQPLTNEEQYKLRFGQDAIYAPFDINDARQEPSAAIEFPKYKQTTEMESAEFEALARSTNRGYSEQDISEMKQLVAYNQIFIRAKKDK